MKSRAARDFSSEAQTVERPTIPRATCSFLGGAVGYMTLKRWPLCKSSATVQFRLAPVLSKSPECPWPFGRLHHASHVLRVSRWQQTSEDRHEARRTCLELSYGLMRYIYYYI